MKNKWYNYELGITNKGIELIKKFKVEDLPCKIAGYISHDTKDRNFFDPLKYVEKKECFTC